MASLILTEVEISFETRRKNKIQTKLSRRKPQDGDYDQQAAEERRTNAQRRRVGPCNTYDCHGLTFGARRANFGWDQIDQILVEDDYTEISKTEVLPGDIVIYRSTPDPSKGIANYVMHSGIILRRLPLADLEILSKWGHGDEWIHTLSDCPYSTANLKFYRINDDPRAKKR